MGITVLSTVSANSALPALSGGTSSDALPIDFAALLGEQLASTVAGLMPLDRTKSDLAETENIAALLLSSGKGNTDKLKTEGDAELAIDPEQLAELAALNPLLAAQIMPSTPPVSGNLLNTTSELQDEDFNGNKPQISLTEEHKGKSSLVDELTAAFGRPDILASSHKDNPQNFAMALSDAGTQLKNGPLNPASIDASKVDVSKTNLTEAANIAVELPTPQTQQPTFSAALNAASSQINTHTHASDTSAHIPTPIHETRWAQDFGEKIVWLAKNEQQTAQISINPPQLGPMQISLSMNGDQANAIFASPHAEVRQAIEDAMPRLREMLSTAGISLGDANVGTQLPQQSRDNAPQFSNSSPNGARFQDENAILGGDSKASGNSGTLPIQRGRGLVDLFA